jgi:hypothetical protein
MCSRACVRGPRFTGQAGRQTGRPSVGAHGRHLPFGAEPHAHEFPSYTLSQIAPRTRTCCVCTSCVSLVSLGRKQPAGCGVGEVKGRGLGCSLTRTIVYMDKSGKGRIGRAADGDVWGRDKNNVNASTIAS